MLTAKEVESIPRKSKGYLEILMQSEYSADFKAFARKVFISKGVLWEI